MWCITRPFDGLGMGARYSQSIWDGLWFVVVVVGAGWLVVVELRVVVRGGGCGVGLAFVAEWLALLLWECGNHSSCWCWPQDTPNSGR